LYIRNNGLYKDKDIQVKMCLTPDHDVLTKFGWKHIKDVTTEDLVCTRNMYGLLVWESPIYTSIYDCKYEYIFDLATPHIEQTVSLNHKMFVKLNGEKCFNLQEARNVLNKMAIHCKSANSTECELARKDIEKVMEDKNVYITKSWDTAQDLQTLALKAEWSADILFSNDSYVVSLHKCTEYATSCVNATLRPYNGIMYDIKVPNNIYYIRKNGKVSWTGSSC